MTVLTTKDVSFYEYMDSKKIFNAIKNNQIKFSEVKNKQNNFLKKLNEVKIVKRTYEPKKVIDNHDKFYLSREGVINFFRDRMKMLSMLIMMQNEIKQQEQDIKYQHLNKCFKDYQ